MSPGASLLIIFVPFYACENHLWRHAIFFMLKNTRHHCAPFAFLFLGSWTDYLFSNFALRADMNSLIEEHILSERSDLVWNGERVG